MPTQSTIYRTLFFRAVWNESQGDKPSISAAYDLAFEAMIMQMSNNISEGQDIAVSHMACAVFAKI